MNTTRMSGQKRRRGRGPAVFAVLAVAAVTALTGTVDARAAAADDRGAAIVVVPDATAQERTLSGWYGDEKDPTGWLTVPASATSLTFLLPEEFPRLGLTSVHAEGTAYGAGFDELAAVDLTTNTVTVSIEGPLRSDPDPTDPWAPTSSRLRWTISTGGTTYPRSHVSLSGNLAIVAGDGNTSATVPLPASQRSSVGAPFTQLYTARGSVGESPQWVVPGQTITVQAPTDSAWDAGARGTAITAHTGLQVLEGTLEQGGSVLGLSPGNDQFRDLSEGNSYSTVRFVSADGASSARARIEVQASLVFARPSGRPGILTARVSDDDRYRGASAMAGAGHAVDEAYSAQGTLYLASGQTFADALSVGAMAARTGSDLLLLPHDVDPSLDDSVRPYLYEHVVIVGGENSVSSGWIGHLQQLGFDSLEIERIDGADRYAVSRSLARAGHPDGADHVFIATGASYPDALSAIPAAAAGDSPVLLVPGSASQLDTATLATLDRLGASRVTLLGGTASVSAGIQAQLESRFADETVERIGGTDRFAVAANVAAAFSDDLPGSATGAPEVFLASGSAFADALTGGVLAARHRAPILLARAWCLPAETATALLSRDAGHVTLLGGPATLGAGAESLTGCG